MGKSKRFGKYLVFALGLALSVAVPATWPQVLSVFGAPLSVPSLSFSCSVFSVLNLFPFFSLDRNPPLPQTAKPEWCKPLPRPEYKSLQRVLPDDPWFEVYKVVPGVFAIYEPHQAEETIGYLIVGTKQALLFDTGMGIANIRNVVSRLTSRPIVVLNSHTHNDHVGDNWRFPFVYGMDTAFTRANAKGSREDAQAEIAPDQICGELPKGFNPKTYATKPWHISLFVHDGFKINLGGRTLEILSTPGHTPDAISLIDRENGFLFTGDTYYPAPIWLYRPETDLDAYVASVKRLAALAPQIKIVLGAHNIPVAQPDVLPRLVDAIQAVRSGKGEVKPEGAGKAMHTLGDFKFLLAEPKKGID
jgi:glyoxylase-like metal-dependent hydrolase (beta-lactamase superfamily II)